MKTFREMISWELEQDAKQKAFDLSLTEDHGVRNLSASVMRKLRYLSSASTAGQKSASQGFNPA